MAGTAFAGAFALREQGAAGQGQAFAGAAAGSAFVGSMYWNPATMTDLDGLQFQLDLTAILPYADITPEKGTSPTLLGLGGTGSTGDIAIDAVLPTGYVSYQLNDRVWLGLALNSPFGLTTKNPFNYAGQIYARTSEVRSYDINPTIAIKVNDWLSLGAGIEALYFKTRLTQAMSPYPDAATASLEGDDWGIGYTLGFTLKPSDSTEIGVGYRSSVNLGLSGDLALGAAKTPLPAGTYGIDATLHTPDQITVGLKQKVTDKLTVNAGFEWTNWSRFGTIPVYGNTGMTNGMKLTELAFEYQDGYYVALGAEYQWTDQFTIRGGLGYEWSPITTTNRDLRLPDSDRIHAALGGTYQINNSLALDMAYEHIFPVGNGDISITSGNPHYVTGLPFTGSVTSDVNIVSIGLRYRFGG
ncbi:hypothetical protein FJU08_15110 [Martelella alba]|uniref:Long-chain fatty acid transport protein n=1 Tax=Martelella alba TaxID=2590451 RepID=A0A506UBK3_9HYPH|nr:outer membrane protein transport protein [Martelella alba]TPW29177.1 hypothetical protein FJU08_15110 [Martelella alba]